MLNDILAELTIEKINAGNTDDLYAVVDRIPIFVESPDAVQFVEEVHRGSLNECVEVLITSAFRMAVAYSIADSWHHSPWDSPRN
jgi:hypothetical protein